MGFLGINKAHDPIALVHLEYARLKQTGFPVAFKLIDHSVLEILSDRDRTRASIDEDKMHPTGLVWLLVSNCTCTALASGNYHIYRGTLSGNGREMLGLFEHASREMVRYGLQTLDECEQDIKKLKVEIKSM